MYRCYTTYINARQHVQMLNHMYRCHRPLVQVLDNIYRLHIDRWTGCIEYKPHVKMLNQKVFKYINHVGCCRSLGFQNTCHMFKAKPKYLQIYLSHVLLNEATGILEYRPHVKMLDHRLFEMHTTYTPHKGRKIKCIKPTICKKICKECDISQLCKEEVL